MRPLISLVLSRYKLAGEYGMIFQISMYRCRIGKTGKTIANQAI